MAEFEAVDLNAFLGEDNYSDEAENKVYFLTPKERSLIDELFSKIKDSDSGKYQIFSDRLKDLEVLAKAVGRFPSLLEKHELAGGLRTPKLLIDSLIKHTNGTGSSLRLPSKAVLGRGFLVAKMHTTASIAHYAKNTEGCEKIAKGLEDETTSSMFSLLAEDVYLNLIQDETQPMEFRREWCLSLLLLWEHWTDSTIENIAPVLQSVWTARRRLAPAFGTMMGTSELLLISMQMDEQWIQFIKQKMGEPGVTQAMEEFLFGISYEQILTLRQMLRTKGIAAIGRDEVTDFLGEHVKADALMDYRDFYSLYKIRRENARSRRRLRLEGPQKTLEDYFVQFVTEMNKEKQKNDTFAK